MNAQRRHALPYGIEPGIVDKIPDTLFRGLEDDIRALHRLDGKRRLRDCAFYCMLWCAGAALLLLDSATNDAPLWRQAAGTLLAALGLNGCVLLVHEGMHGTLFKSTRTNRMASILLSCTHLMSFTAYQVLHIRHHKHVGNDGDPDYYGNYVDSKPLLWLMHGLRLAAAAFLYLIAIPVLAWRGSGRSVRRRVVQEYLVLAAIVLPVVLWVPGDVLIDVWLIPMVIVAVITQMRAFAQHTLTDASQPLLAARSMRPAWVVSYLMLHENYHLEHHLFPRVPSYHLPALARLLEPRLPRFVVGSSYIALILRFLRASLTLDETPVVVRERATPRPAPELEGEPPSLPLRGRDTA